MAELEQKVKQLEEEKSQLQTTLAVRAITPDMPTTGCLSPNNDESNSPVMQDMKSKMQAHLNKVASESSQKRNNFIESESVPTTHRAQVVSGTP